MAKRIFVNGACGRIGRAVTYEILQSKSPDLALVALNDPEGIDKIERNYKRRDSTHGRLNWEVRKQGSDILLLNGNPIKVYAEKDLAKIPFAGEGIQIVEECSGFYSKEDAAVAFLQMADGIERVIMSYPAKGKQFADLYATLVMGVNHETFNPEKHRCISNASCTTKALAAPLAVLEGAGITIDALLMDTVHAATNSQRLLDFGDDYAALNQISTYKTGAAIATGEVLPSLKGKMDGLSFRVPTADGSFANLYFVASVPGELTSELINGILRDHLKYPRYAGRLAVHEEKEAASADIIGRTENAIVIASKTRVFPLPYKQEGRNTYLVGLVSGYDNEIGPPRDQALLTEYIAQRTSHA